MHCETTAWVGCNSRLCGGPNDRLFHGWRPRRHWEWFHCCRMLPGGVYATRVETSSNRGRGEDLVGRGQLCSGLNERPSNGRVGWATMRGMNFVLASIRGFPMNDVLGDSGNGSISDICCRDGGDARQVALSSSLGEGARVPSGARGKDHAHTHAGVV